MTIPIAGLVDLDFRPFVFALFIVIAIGIGLIIYFASRRLTGGSTHAHSSNRLPRRLAFSAASLFVVVAFAPVIVVGETWGNAWFLITTPFAQFTRDFIGFEPYPLVFYVLGTTLIAAASWATLIYVCATLIQRFTKVA